jgi:Fic family protein
MPFSPEIEPMIPSVKGIDQSDLPMLALDLERKAGVLSGMVNPITANVLEEHMRVVNSYYSNLIEGHKTHPRDIRKAMQGRYSDNSTKRDLQLESIAHIHAQKQLTQHPPSATELLSGECFRNIHQMLYEQLPENLRVVASNQGMQKKIVPPGEFRQTGEDVVVGEHVAPPSQQIDTLLCRFEQAYRIEYLHGQMRVIAVMAAHHRFTWIHPFLDGNGRVGRLHTDLFLKSIGLGAHGIWCLSRGLARGNEEYKASLARADQAKQGDRDGRGTLSEKYLIAFCEFMIKTAIDQVEYMRTLLELQGMEKRIQAYIDDRNKGLIIGLEKIKPEAARLIEKAFIYGQFERKDMDKISGLSSSVTRKVVQQLKEEGLLTETSSRSPLKWAIPEHAERYYLPQLAPAFGE